MSVESSVSTVDGVALAAVALDALPREAARRHPDAVAVRAGEASLTFAELDARVDALARALVARIGSGGVVGVPAVLTTDFAVAYYAAARSGNVVVTVNPFLREPALRHLVTASALRLLFVTPELAGRIAAATRDLASGPALVAFGATAPADLPEATPVADLLATAGDAELPGPPADLDAPAGIHFTSGTTGPAKGVLLSHRNLTVNAAQVAAAHGLRPGTAIVNHLPTYHLMHLNSGVRAGVTQVLCPGDDTAAALAAANAHRATRLYSLPVRLARLADSPALPGLRLETVVGILSGGSALPPPAARKLAAHFGIPVTQGYGLAETSPLTHTERLDAPRTGSVGPVVAGTECRVVDLDTRRPVAEGVRGEVQVRGPQVMRGYLDPALPTGIDAEGWLSTGDIGYVDTDGYLFLVDRIKDIFKCDNEIVSPTELERLLDRHPAVRESVVVDHPDPHRGAVAHGFVVLADPAAPVEVEEIRATVNAEVPEYQHIRYLEVVSAIPRSPNGKVARRDIRAWVERPGSVPANRPTDTTGVPPMVTFINQLTVTGTAEEFEKISARMSEFMASRPGYLNHRLLRSLRAPESYIEIAEWENPEAHQAAVRSDEFQALIKELGRVVAKPTPGLFTDVKPAH